MIRKSQSSNSRRKPARRTRIVVGTGLVVLTLMALSVALWLRHFQTYTPAAALRDLRAAAQVRNAEHPVEPFLEARYGSLRVPANRQKALLDFFEVGHIEGLYLITGHLAGDRKQATIAEMAQWIANYRTNMPAEDQEALHKYLGTDAGRAMVQGAAKYYLQKDVRFRAESAPVIQELMTTLSTLQQP